MAALGAMTVPHLGGAFVLQHGIGAVAGLWGRDSAGHHPVQACETVLALLLVLQVAALPCFTWPALPRQPRRMGQLGQG